MKLMCKTFVFGLAVAAASAVGCSSGQSRSGSGLPGTGDHAGEVDLNLTLQGGQTITTLSYTLSNAVPADTLTGTITLPTGAAGPGPFAVPTFEVIPVQAGTGYTVSLTGTSTDGTVTCSGTSSPPFTVTAGADTSVNVLVTCVKASTSGTVGINPTIQNCPTVGNLVAVGPAASTVAPGNTSTIFGSAVGVNPAQLTYAFSVTAGTGTLSGQIVAPDFSSSNILFTCPAVGEVDTITLVTSDQTGAVCPASLTTLTTKVTCGVPPAACIGVGTGVEATPDTAAGTCPAGTANTLKDAAGNFCCAQLPACSGVGSGTEATPDTAAGTCPAGQSNTLKDAQGNFCCVGLQACTTAGQTGCVQCTGSANAPLCTPTEAQFIALDIKNKLDTAAGPAATGSCYQCLNVKGCLDDNLGDTGSECEDGAFSGGTTVAECANTLTCILGTACNASALSACYCGAATPSGTCTTDTTSVSDPVPASTNPAVIGGSCDVEISTGLALSITDGIDVLKGFTNAQLAAGRANAILACGVAGKCTACQ